MPEATTATTLATTPPLRTTLVVGNPKAGSRTLDAARLLAQQLTGAPAQQELDLVTLGAALLDWNAPVLKEAVQVAAQSQLLIVACPTYKASYTGLLKLFLDNFAGQTGLQGVVAVPLMLGGSERHALAPDLLLKPVLVEIGATCPTPGLYLVDKSYDTDAALPAFATRWKPVVDALLATPHRAGAA